jgi:hypothetical protein
VKMGRSAKKSIRTCMRSLRNPLSSLRMSQPRSDVGTSLAASIVAWTARYSPRLFGWMCVGSSSGASGARSASVILIVAQAVVAFWTWKRWRSHGGRRIEELKYLSTDEKIRYSNAR